MIEFKSKVFISFLWVLIALTLLGGILFFFSIGTYWNIVTAVIALVIMVLLVQKHRYAIPWIRGLFGFNIGLSTIFLLSSGCAALLGDTTDRSLLLKVLFYGDRILTIILSSIVYILTPKYIIHIPKPIAQTENIPDSVIAEKLKLPKNK